MLHAGLLRPSGNSASDAGPPDWPQTFTTLAGQARGARLKKYYGAGAAAPDTPLSQTPMMALGVETTGPDPEVDAPAAPGTGSSSHARLWARNR